MKILINDDNTSTYNTITTTMVTQKMQKLMTMTHKNNDITQLLKKIEQYDEVIFDLMLQKIMLTVFIHPLPLLPTVNRKKQKTLMKHLLKDQ